MSNPVLVEILRGDIVESTHRGAISVMDFEGKSVLEIGNTQRPVFPRSAVKAIQALPLLETGAADAFGFNNRELALACASHSSEPQHVALAAEMLAKCGLDETALECGSHWPTNHDSMIALARSGNAPNQLYNNCSGKHSGFLSVCRHCGIDHRGYVAFGHPFQEMVRETMQEVTGAAHDADNMATDGCAIPTYAVPLTSLALGFAKMGGGKGLSSDRARAAQRLLSANMAYPFLVAGTDKVDTKLMGAAPGRIFVKTGAEGVYCGVVPEKHLAFAVKCDDGAGRGAETIVATLLARLFSKEEGLAVTLQDIARPPIRNRKREVVGATRPTAALDAFSLMRCGCVRR